MNNLSPIDRFIALSKNREEVYEQVTKILSGKKLSVLVSIRNKENFLYSHPQFRPFIHDGDFICNRDADCLYIENHFETIRYQNELDDYPATLLSVKDLSEFSEISLSIFGETEDEQVKTINRLYEQWLSLAEQHSVAYNQYYLALNLYSERRKALDQLEKELYERSN